MSVTLRPNPFSHVTVRHLADEPAELRVWSVTRSRGAVTRNISRSMRADFDRVCTIVSQAGASRDEMPSIEDYVVLTALGLWAPETELIDPISLEAPIRSGSVASSGPWPSGGFVLRGEAWLQHGSEPNPPVADVPLGCLSAARPILWHRGSELEPIWPWWPDGDCLAAIEAVQRGLPLCADMLPSLQALADQNILVRQPTTQCCVPPLSLESARGSFARDGFVGLRQLLPPGQIAAFRAYWRQLAALDVFPQRGDNRRGSHGEPSTMLLQYLLKPLIEHLVGSPIKPSFSYAWCYDRGTVMPPHRDRAESRYTVTYLADYTPDIDGPIPWPLFVYPRGWSAPVEIRQTVGDPVLFCGEELTHFRPAFTAGERATSLLLHYVDEGAAGYLF
jgi:hypothetical protein